MFLRTSLLKGLFFQLRVFRLLGSDALEAVSHELPPSKRLWKQNSWGLQLLRQCHYSKDRME